MAIVKMKKLCLAAVRTQKEDLLKDLARLGCVEFSEIKPEEASAEAQAGLRRESSNLINLRSQHAEILRAIDILDKYAPQKSGLLASKPEVEADELLDGVGIGVSQRLAGIIAQNDENVRRMTAEEARQRTLMESLEPWLPLNLPLNFEGTERTSAVLGTLPARVELGDVSAAVYEVTDEAELIEVSADKTCHYIMMICMKEDFKELQDVLRGFGFSVSPLSNISKSARACRGDIETELGKMAIEKKNCEDAIASEAIRRDYLKLNADRLETKIAMAEAEEELIGTESCVVMRGWVPEEREAELSEVLQKYDCAWETEEPDVSEYPDVPVKLKNNAVTDSLNMVTNMYSLPAYGTVDPNPLMAPFFILFYGLMMADMGYGLLMIIAAVVALIKIKPREGTLSFCRLLLYAGISTFVMGILTGSFFADLPLRVAQMINPATEWQGLWHLFDPTKDSVMIMIGAMALGVIHLNVGMGVSFVQKCKNGDVWGAVLYEGALWVILLGAAGFALGKFMNLGTEFVGKILLIAGAVMLIIGTVKEKKGIFNMLLGILVLAYNEVTGWFGDILSYSRIMALMLAGSVIGTVFNTIASITGNIVFFVIIFLVGHALNFGLNILGCYVHDLRLQCLEFFGKFYTDGGRAFNPLKIKTRYYNTVEQ